MTELNARRATDAAPVTTLILHRRRRAWRFEGTDRDAWLRTWHGMHHGEIQVADRSWSVGVTDRRRIGVVARTGDRPVVLLDPRQARVPGPGGPVRWAPHWHHGSLTRDAARIHVQLSAWPRGRIRIDVTGAWPELELVALTAAFALLTRRHRRMVMMMVVAGAIGHGPVG
jgi:hypothetical protein